VARFAGLLRAVEFGLHPLATLVRAGFVAGNPQPASSPGTGSLAFYRRFPHQASPVWLQSCKRVSTRYEKLALTFLSFILFAGIFDWLKSY
jgi:transposase